MIDERDALGRDHAEDEARQRRVDRRQPPHRRERAHGAGQLRQIVSRPEPVDAVGIQDGVVEWHFQHVTRFREAAERDRAGVEDGRRHAFVRARDEQGIAQPDLVAGPERPARERQAVDEQRHVPVDGLEGELSGVDRPDAAAALAWGRVVW